MSTHPAPADPITVAITPKAAEDKKVPRQLIGHVKAISAKGAVLFTSGGHEWWFAPSQIKQLHPDGSKTPITQTATGRTKKEPRKAAWVEGEKIWVVLEPYNDSERQLCNRLGGWYDRDKKAWEFFKSLRTVLTLLRNVPGLQLDERLQIAVTKHKAKQALTRKERALAMPPIPGLLHPERWYQRDAFYFVKSKGYTAELAIKMGYGKTLIALGCIRNTGSQHTLVLCPKAVVAVWPREVLKHLGPGYRVLALNSKAGTVEERAGLLGAAWVDPDPRPLIVVCNYEAAIYPPLGPLYETYTDADEVERQRQVNDGLILSLDWDMKIFDESHKLIAPGGRTSIFCSKIRARYALNMTGTPEKEGPLDWYGQARALRPGLLGWRWTEFRARYAIIDSSEGYPKILGYQNLDELNEQLAQFVYQVEGEQLDLPPTSFQDYYAELKDETRRHYREIARDLATVYEGEEVTEKNQLTAQLDLARLAGGWLVTDNERRHYLDTGKRLAAEEIMNGIAPEEPVVIVYRFDTDLMCLRSMMESLHRPWLELNGHKDQWIEWMEGKAPVLLLQIQAGNMGVDLTQCGTHPCGLMILYSVGFGLIDYMQLLKRVNRSGQTVPVTYARLMAEGTIDEYIYQKLQEKAEAVEAHLISVHEAQTEIERGAIAYTRAMTST